MAAAKPFLGKTAATELSPVGMTAATELNPETPLPRSTKLSANVVFINIDWKASRHSRLNANMRILGETIANVVRNMRPAMICMSEVGESKIPLTQDQMQQVSDQVTQSWKEAATELFEEAATENFEEAATEHFELRSMFQAGAPYMTVYQDGPLQCSCHRILNDIYYARGLPRTAQTFLCRGPGNVTIDVINVHAPSPTTMTLKDHQRATLLTNLLQSDSKSMPGRAVGSARFLIGGDMNTMPVSLTHLLQDCRNKSVLETQEQIHQPVLGLHGDICFHGGFIAETLSTTAENHDPKHKPYGVRWLMVQEKATEQGFQDETRQQERAAQTKDRRAEQERAAPSSGSATEHPLQAYPAPDPTPEAAMPARLELENLENRAQQTGVADMDIETELESMHPVESMHRVCIEQERESMHAKREDNWLAGSSLARLR